MKVLLPFVCVVLFVAFTTADIVGGMYHPSYKLVKLKRRVFILDSSISSELFFGEVRPVKTISY
jgi:hypothetical protein